LYLQHELVAKRGRGALGGVVGAAGESEMAVRGAVYKQNSKCWRLTDVPDVLGSLRATFVT